MVHTKSQGARPSSVGLPHRVAVEVVVPLLQEPAARTQPAPEWVNHLLHTSGNCTAVWCPANHQRESAHRIHRTTIAGQLVASVTYFFAFSGAPCVTA